MSFICPLLSRLHWPLQLFSDVQDPGNVIEKAIFIWTKKLVKVQGSSHKRNEKRKYKRLEATERLISLFILPITVGLPQKLQTEHTDTLS